MCSCQVLLGAETPQHIGHRRALDADFGTLSGLRALRVPNVRIIETIRWQPCHVEPSRQWQHRFDTQLSSSVCNSTIDIHSCRKRGASECPCTFSFWELTLPMSHFATLSAGSVAHSMRPKASAPKAIIAALWSSEMRTAASSGVGSKSVLPSSTDGLVS